ncbi:MAG: hypothetical protein AB1656_18830 [Candidatus Omnitrophota bacterium]
MYSCSIRIPAPSASKIFLFFLFFSLSIIPPVFSFAQTNSQEGVSSAALAGATKSRLDDNYLREMFGKLLPKLESALEMKDLHETLPKRTLIYGKDQKTNQEEINVMLDQAIEVLNISDVNEDRVAIRDLQKRIKEAYISIARYREQRLSAPPKETLGMLGKMNPLQKSKEDYDALIAGEEGNIAGYQEKIGEIKSNFTRKLQEIGLSIAEEGVNSLLDSVVGDDFIKLCNVFDNLKKVVAQLQQLTEDSGESLEIAKRYYGMYVILNEILDRIQKQYIGSITGEYIPALQEFIQSAKNNIEEAKRLAAENGEYKERLNTNIDSNQLTIEASEKYIDYLRRQADEIAKENAEVVKNAALANNTYKTVKVSGGVAVLIQDGRQWFEALMKLKMPELRGFENKVLKQEFLRLTEEMREMR